MTQYDRLTALDASFLHMERLEHPMHVGAMSVLEGEQFFDGNGHFRIGEVRDLETAEIAVQSALTGHLVLSTIHTNDAASTVNRLLDMGVEDYLLTSTVIGILAQRLVRTLCDKCREPHAALPEFVEQMGLRRFQPMGEITLYKPVGCAECAGTGYFGRVWSYTQLY